MLSGFFCRSEGELVVKWLEREKERKGIKSKEQIAAKSLYWDSVVVQIEKTSFQSFLLINFLF